MSRMIGCCAFLLVVLLCVEAAPHDHEKEASNGNESESHSPEIETKETKESSEETEEEESDYEETDGLHQHNPASPDHHDKKKRDNVRADLLRHFPLPETYGVPAEGNTDMMTIGEILAEQ